MQENLYTPNSIRTRSGRYINVLELAPDTIAIEDIAHALSNVPRFGGHLPNGEPLPFYFSVGQHSLGVHHEVSRHTTDRSILLQALMHDASDFLIGDQPSPIKQFLPDFKAMEERIMQAIARQFGFPWPMHPLVKEADRKHLELEWFALMLGKEDPAMVIRRPDTVRDQFLRVFNELSTGAVIIPDPQPTHHLKNIER